jgi:IclR family acetate operon transcriptional repressor
MTAASTSKPGKASPAYPISSVDNALRLLLMFRDHNRLRLSEVANALDVAHSTAHRLLAMLAYHDFVRQEGDLRTYVAGPALLDIGFAAVRHMDIRTLARPVLEDLARKVEETVHLVQLEGSNVRYIAAAECNRPLRVADRTGLVMPAHTTATGKALLADLPEGEVDALLSDVTSSDGSGLTLDDRALIGDELAEVRERGYSTNYRNAEDILSLATGVRDKHGRPLAALSASAPKSRMTRRRQLEVVRQLHAAAARLEELLGTAEKASD